MTPGEALGSVADMKAAFRLLRDERTVFEKWEQLVAAYQVRGKNTHDARIVAAMQRHDVRHLLTFNDQDFNRYGEIIVVAPSDPLAAFG